MTTSSGYINNMINRGSITSFYSFVLSGDESDYLGPLFPMEYASDHGYGWYDAKTHMVFHMIVDGIDITVYFPVTVPYSSDSILSNRELADILLMEKAGCYLHSNVLESEMLVYEKRLRRLMTYTGITPDRTVYRIGGYDIFFIIGSFNCPLVLGIDGIQYQINELARTCNLEVVDDTTYTEEEFLVDLLEFVDDYYE